MSTLTELLGGFAKRELGEVSKACVSDPELRQTTLFVCEGIVEDNLDWCRRVIEQDGGDSEKLTAVDETIISLVQYRDILYPVPTIDWGHKRLSSKRQEKLIREVEEVDTTRRQALVDAQSTYYEAFDRRLKFYQNQDEE